MKKDKDYFGIYINNKVPKLNENGKKYYNEYNGNIKLEFEGKAYILKQSGEIKEELKNNSKFKKEGKHTIKFINNKKKIYYINIEIKKHILYVLFFILLLGMMSMLIPLGFNEEYNKNQRIVELTDLDIDLQGNKYVFDINYKNTDFQSIEFTDKVSKKDIIYPGANGFFYIQISTKDGNKDMNYIMQIKEEKNKPENLKFEMNGNIYNSMTELADSINGVIQKDTNEIIKIEWFWDYETSKNDIIDTNDGQNLDTYKVLMRMIGNERK